MGLPMSKNLLDEGYRVFGYDINPAATEKFASHGGNVSPEVKDVLTNAEVVFISLPSPPIVESVYFGEGGIINCAKKGRIIIDTSTVSPELNRKLEKACNEKRIKYWIVRTFMRFFCNPLDRCNDVAIMW